MSKDRLAEIMTAFDYTGVLNQECVPVLVAEVKRLEKLYLDMRDGHEHVVHKMSEEVKRLEAERDELENHIGEHGCDIVRVTKENARLRSALNHALGKFNAVIDDPDVALAKCVDGARQIRDALKGGEDE